MTTRVPILLYHEVSPRLLPGFRKYCVTPQAFTRQMRWLAIAGYTTIDLDRLLDARSGRTELPARPVVITFDDGFRDCLEHTLPVLKALDFTATYYLVAGLIGQNAAWLRAERSIDLPLADWPQVREIEAAGSRVGAHTLTHPRLTGLPVDACRDELLRSRLLLEDRLGTDVRHMAYPFGAFDERVRELVAEVGYRSARSGRIGVSPPDDDPLSLCQVSVSGHDSLPDFICRLRTARPIGKLLRQNAHTVLASLRRRKVRPC